MCFLDLDVESSVALLSGTFFDMASRTPTTLFSRTPVSAMPSSSSNYTPQPDFTLQSNLSSVPSVGGLPGEPVTSVSETPKPANEVPTPASETPIAGGGEPALACLGAIRRRANSKAAAAALVSSTPSPPPASSASPCLPS